MLYSLHCKHSLSGYDEIHPKLSWKLYLLYARVTLLVAHISLLLAFTLSPVLFHHLFHLSSHLP
jgi:hypothetical protein